LLSRLLNDVVHRFPYTISFMLGNELVVLENESHSTARDSIAPQLPSLLGNDFTCGVSTAREGIRQCQLLYRQAQREARRCAENGIALSYADERTRDYLVEALNRDELLASYVHPEIVRLHHYDEANGTRFYETLRAYTLASFHLSDAARYLNLHRNSLDYRLKRIREIIDFSDFDSLMAKPDEGKLVELIISFAVIDARNGN
jgi:DNA-binding PucR family transcriptional regulator